MLLASIQQLVRDPIQLPAGASWGPCMTAMGWIQSPNVPPIVHGSDTHMTAAGAAGAGPSKEEGSANKDAMPPAPELVKKPARKVVKKPQPPPGPDGSHVTGEAAAAAAEPPSAVEEEAKSSAPVKKRVVRVVKAKAPQAPRSDAAATLGATSSSDATTTLGATPSSDATPLGIAPLDPLPVADEGLGGSQASPPSPVPLPASSRTPADANGASAALHVDSPAEEMSSPVGKQLSASLLTPPRRPRTAPTSHASASKQKVDPAEADHAGPGQEPPHDQEQPYGGSGELSPAAHVGSPSTSTTVSEAVAKSPAFGSQTAASADKEADDQPQDDALLAHTLPGSSLPPAHAPAEDSHGQTSEPSGPPDLPVPAPPSTPNALSGLSDTPPTGPSASVSEGGLEGLGDHPGPSSVSGGGLGGLGELSRAALEALAVQLQETAAEGRGQLVKDAEQISYLQQVGGVGGSNNKAPRTAFEPVFASSSTRCCLTLLDCSLLPGASPVLLTHHTASSSYCAGDCSAAGEERGACPAHCAHQ